ncbi:MAG TPA: autoinducer-2 kinase [Gaiellales bacterium]|jgi:autoinducer 2 (AI-2) kinase
MREHLLTIDAGTGSVRAVLFDLDGNQVAIGQREYSHAPAPGVPGSQVFDTAGNWRLVRACIAEAIERSGAPTAAIRAVSATSMREGMVLYDRAGHEIWACPNVDSRAGDQAAALVESGAAAEIYARAGDWVAITAPARFRWIAERAPEVFAQAAHVGMLGDWLCTRLTGEFATDPSLGSSSGMFDLATRTWSPEILELLELDPGLFPPVRESGTPIGAVTAAAAAETGIPAGTPVVAGGADTQLGLLGIGVRTPGRTTVVGGSFWQHTMLFSEPVIDPHARLRTLCHTVPGQWMVEGIGFYSGLAMRWFRDAFCAADKGRAAQLGVDVYDLLAQDAAGVPPGSNGVLGIFSNVMDAKRWIHASPGFVQFDLGAPERSGKNECFRAIQEAAAYVSRAHAGILAEVSGVTPTEVVFTAGAARGRMWAQILADVLGVPARVPVVKESSALGAAVCAGLGAGLYSSLADVDRLVRFSYTAEPDPARAARYDELYAEWSAAYAGLLEPASTGAVRPLWRASGT